MIIAVIVLVLLSALIATDPDGKDEDLTS